MRTLSTLLLTASLLAHIHGQSIYDISDVPAYSSLAPCAMSAVSYNVYTLTNSLCPDGITALQSCACTKAGVSGKVALTISSDALYSCGSTASEDISSAASVFAQYCNQDAPLPTPNIRNEAVTHEITELPYYSELAPCARSAVSYAVNSMTNYLCRDGAPELNSCVCTKNQNSFRVSRSIASDVRYSCGSTRSADVASALALFDGYCAMGAGTTSFPTVSQLKGDVSYYVDDLPAFGSLADCAASAVSYGVYSFTNYFCNGGPKALASCVCEKDDNSALASKEIVSDVQWSCSSDATEDINSALAVFSEYCGAARGELEVVGVTASVAEPTASLDPGSGPSPQATGNSNQPPSTSSPNANGDPSNQDNDPNETGTSAVGNEVSIGGGVNTAAIGGAVGGGVGALLIIGGAFLLRRRNRRQKRAAAAAAAAYDPNTGSGSADGNAAEGGAGAGAGVVGGGLQEKDGAAIAAIPTSREGEELDGKALVRGYKSPIYGTTELASNAPHSPHEQYQSPVSPQERTDAELSGTPRPYGSELPGNGYAGFVRGVHEAPGSGGGGYGHEMPAQGMGYQAGPVYEMPAYSQPQAQPPPQQYQAWQGGSVAGIGRKPVGGA